MSDDRVLEETLQTIARALCGEVMNGVCSAHSGPADNGWCFLGALNARTAVSAAFPVLTAHALAGKIDVADVISFASDERDEWWDNRIEALQSEWRGIAWDDDRSDPGDSEWTSGQRATYELCADALDGILQAAGDAAGDSDESKD